MSIFSSKSIRLKTETQGQNDSFVTLQMKQTYDFINILSLKLPTKNIFQQFSSDFGVVCGRVSSNGLGIPNSKVALFIPKDNAEITARLAKCKTDIDRQKISIAELLYPYTSVDDKDSEGRRFNLLPSKRRNRGFNGFKSNFFGIGSTPKTPLGTFPEKEEILSNEPYLEVFDTYYKYTTVTNSSGDFFIYAPVGSYVLTCQTDITDIGRFSVSPALMSKTMGYSESLFDGGTRVKKTKDLDRAPNIIIQDVPITIKPLWNQDSDNPEVGITRQDFELGVELKPSFVVFGSTLNMGLNTFYGDLTKYQVYLGFAKKVLANTDILNLSVGDVSCGSKNDSCSCTSGGLDGKFNIDGDVQFKLPSLDIDFKGFSFNFNAGGFCIRLSVCFVLPAIFPFVKIRALTYQPCAVTLRDFSLGDGVYYLGQVNECADKSIEELILASGKDYKDDLNTSEELSNAENIRTKIQLFSRKNLGPIFDPTSDIELIDESSYATFIESGTFSMVVPANKRRLITAEDGTLIESNSEKGVFSGFDGYMIFSPDVQLNGGNPTLTLFTTKLKVPQGPLDTINVYNTYHSFEVGEVYSVSQYIPQLDLGSDCNSASGLVEFCNDNTNLTGHPYKILNPDIDLSGINNMPISEYNVDFGVNENFNLFRGAWLNFTLYTINASFKKKYGRRRKDLAYCSSLIINEQRLKDNNEKLGGSAVNTKFMANSINIQTQFIQLNKDDIIELQSRIEKGFTSPTFLKSSYFQNYFYKGKYEADGLNNIIYKDLI